jgi:hypothetical protein
MQASVENNCYIVEPERKCSCNARPECIVIDASTNSFFKRAAAVEATPRMVYMTKNELILYCEALNVPSLQVRIPKTMVLDLNSRGVRLKSCAADDIFSLTRNELFLYAHLFKLDGVEVNISPEVVAQLKSCGVKLS